MSVMMGMVIEVDPARFEQVTKDNKASQPTPNFWRELDTPDKF